MLLTIVSVGGIGNTACGFDAMAECGIRTIKKSHAVSYLCENLEK